MKKTRAAPAVRATRDSTTLLRGDDAFAANADLFRKLFACAAVGLAITDLDHRFLEVNQVFCSLTGYSEAELKQTSFLEIIQPTDRLDARQRLRALLAGKTSSFVVERRVIRKDGGIIWIQNSVSLVRDDDARPSHFVTLSQDITERKRTEDEIGKHTEILKKVIDHIPVMINFTGEDGGIHLVNREWERVLGWSLEEIQKQDIDTFAEAYPDPRYRKQVLDFIAAADGKWVDFKTRTRDGRVIDTMWARVKLSDGTTIGIGQDITERKRSEEALSEAERKYRDIFENAVEGIFQTTPAGAFIAANPALAHMLGYESPEELIRERRDIALQGYVDPNGREEFRRLLEKQDRVAGFEHQGYRKDGAKIWMSENVRAVRDASGKVLYYEGTIEDITERKAAEAALRESEERYRELFENDKDAIYVHDLNGVYTSVNRAGEKLSGYSREEIIGRHFQDFVAPECVGQVRESLGKKLEEMGETNYEVEIINRGGARVPVEVSSRPIYKNGIVVEVKGSARDMTERKRAQQALLTYSRRLLDAQESERGRIARELHDQIGQMLTALKLNLHAIQSARDAHEAGPLIEDNLKMLDEALEQVRDLSVDLRPLLLDDLGLVTALRWLIDHQAQRAGVRADFASDSLDPDLRFSAELETACFRIAQEALTNVARHARAKTVTVRLSRSRDYLILLVEDDGVGFEITALQGHALADATLGLRGMEERARAVGGRVKIDSATNRGTQVFVELPISMPNGKKPTGRRVRE